MTKGHGFSFSAAADRNKQANLTKKTRSEADAAQEKKDTSCKCHLKT